MCFVINGQLSLDVLKDLLAGPPCPNLPCPFDFPAGIGALRASGWAGFLDPGRRPYPNFSKEIANGLAWAAGWWHANGVEFEPLVRDELDDEVVMALGWGTIQRWLGRLPSTAVWDLLAAPFIPIPE